MKLDDCFDKEVCINLKRRADRWGECQEEFKKHGIERVERHAAVDGRNVAMDGVHVMPGEIALTITHIQILNEALDNDLRSVLVLEDDVEFAPDFQEKFEVAWSEVPNDWEIVYFGGNHQSPPIPFKEHVSICNRTFAMHAVAIRQPAFEKMLDLLYLHSNTFPVDVIYGENLHKMKSFVFTPPLAWQRPGYSDINQAFKDYDFLRK
jgi:GR25 family glycosyltransferase involved in LPS biosynthesis